MPDKFMWPRNERNLVGSGLGLGSLPGDWEWGFPGQLRLPLADKLIYVRDKCGKCGFLFFHRLQITKCNAAANETRRSICSTYFKFPNYRELRQIEADLS